MEVRSRPRKSRPLQSCHWRRLPVAAVLLAVSTFSPALAQTASRVFISDVSGVIGVATTRQIARAIDQASNEKAVALIVRLDTPGGLASSTRELVKQIVAAPVPVIVYVAPSGARAASAGTFLVYASHLAAMAPGTNLGAATPIEIGGSPALPRQAEPDKGEKGGSAAKSQTTEQRKATNDMVALMRSLAQLRERNADWGEKAVREAATLTATDAQREGVVEIVATGVPDLLSQADGRKVRAGGADIVLETKNAETIVIQTDMRTRLLSVISDPNVAFILLMIGFYGLILEFWHPGGLVPGTVGGISLILALVALTLLPVNYGALGLLVLGIALMIGEAFTPGIGVLGIGGVGAFVAGAYFLFEGAAGDAGIAISLPLIIGMAVATATLIFGVVAAAIKARARPPAFGAEQLIGASGQVLDWQGSTGHVRVDGEVWSALSDDPLQAGTPVRITGRNGLTLRIEKMIK